MVYVYNGILLIHKKNGILPFVTTWMELEGIMLSEIRQKTNAIWFWLYAKPKTKQNISEVIDIGNKLLVIREGRGWGDR